MDAKSQEQKDFSIPLYPYQLLDQNPAEKELGETPPLIVTIPAGLKPATCRSRSKSDLFPKKNWSTFKASVPCRFSLSKPL